MGRCSSAAVFVCVYSISGRAGRIEISMQSRTEISVQNRPHGEELKRTFLMLGWANRRDEKRQRER